MPDCVRETALRWSETKSQTLTKVPGTTGSDEVFSVTRTMVASRWRSFLDDSAERKVFFKTPDLRDLLIEDWEVAPSVASPRGFESQDELTPLMKRTFAKIVDMVERGTGPLHYLPFSC